MKKAGMERKGRAEGGRKLVSRIFTGRQHSLLCRCLVIAVAELSVPVRHTLVYYQIKRTQAKITYSSLWASQKLATRLCKIYPKNLKSVTPIEGVKWKGKNGSFQLISRRISETVRDKKKSKDVYSS